MPKYEIRPSPKGFLIFRNGYCDGPLAYVALEDARREVEIRAGDDAIRAHGDAYGDAYGKVTSYGED